MKNIYLLIILLFSTYFLYAQEIKDSILLKSGTGIGALEIGQSYEEVQSILGFGKLKTYEDYIAEELFDQDPNSMLECVIGFDHYIKFEHLITLPVEYVYFKDDTINQVKVTSFPDYYRDLSEDVTTKEGLKFWQNLETMQDLYGKPHFDHKYEWFLLESYFYPEEGVVFNFRDDMLRTAHIFKQTDSNVINKLKSGL